MPEPEPSVLRLGQSITILPVVHGSGDFAVEVRRRMLNADFDCLAVPLPSSFHDPVRSAVDELPKVSVVVQREALNFEQMMDSDPDEGPDLQGTCSYVPIDPCQPVIAALRIALQERMPTEFIDIEDDNYQPISGYLPDPYAVKTVTAEKFATAVLPSLPAPIEESHLRRIAWMANELHRLRQEYSNVLFVCSIIDWPWIRDAFQTQAERPESDDRPEQDPETFPVDPLTLTFLLGELPFITAQYELARTHLDDDENLSVDGIKALLLASRQSYKKEFGRRGRPITPQLLTVMLKYLRNLSLMERRLTPDLYTLATASQQIAGDQFAIHLTETARAYPFAHEIDDEHYARFGVDSLALPDGSLLAAVSRLPGHPIIWRSLQLKARPDRKQQVEWQRSWNPFGQCSWPSEDVAIERFRTHIRDVALDLMGNDLAKTEKFTSSIKDGLDIRETLRNWHTGELYVKEFPPARGNLDCVIMLFDSPADPRDYPWRITWHAETHDESTLSLFATDFTQEVIGPGIALARYGGAMFLFPPRPIVDVFRDPRFDFTDTLEERLIAAGAYYSNEKHIALMSHKPPGAGWRRLVKKHGRKLIHVPMSRFGSATIEKLRMFHVLNGQQVRSYASEFIRKP